MRVLLTADAVGGVWTYATDLADGLAAAGVEVTLAVLGPDERRTAGAGVETIALPDVALDWLAESEDEVLAGAERLAALAERLDVDLIHLNNPALAAGGAFRRPVLGVCHSDVATWWAAVRGGPLPADLAWRAGLTGRGYAACDALLAPTRAFAEATAAAYGALPQVVWNGRGDAHGPRAFCAQAQADACENSAVQPFTDPQVRAECARSVQVFTCGRLWDEGKGAAVLDRAAARLSAPVHAAGPLQSPGSGEAVLHHFHHVHTLGPLPADVVRARMAETAVFCSPALYEPFGLAVLEAAQAGTPLVLSDIPSFRELWDGAAVFTAPGDDLALAEALNRLLADPPERERLGAAARRRAGRYTTEAMVAGTLAAYRGLVGARAAA